MNYQQLDNQVSVSGQITADDVVQLAASGIEVLVCNRPDGEAIDQTPFNEISAAAQQAGLEIVNIPFSGGNLTESHVRAFSDVLGKGKRVHAYCRTGNRCTIIYQASRAMGDRAED